MSKHPSRSSYDALYEHNWDRGSVTLWNSGGFNKGTSFEDVMQFAQFMSKSLGFRLRVTFAAGGTMVAFRRDSDLDY